MKTRLLLAFALVLSACTGGDAGTDTPAADGEPTIEETIMVGSLDDIPQVCRDTFVSMLQTVEPSVEDVEFDTITVEEFDPLFREIDPDMLAFEAEMMANQCGVYLPVTADEVVWQEMLGLAESEAPGSVAFLVWTRELATSFAGDGVGGSELASGNCATDGAALVAIAEEGTATEQMTLAEVAEVTALFASVSTNCTPEEMEPFLDHPAVIAMLG